MAAQVVITVFVIPKKNVIPINGPYRLGLRTYLSAFIDNKFRIKQRKFFHFLFLNPGIGKAEMPRSS